MSDTVSWRPECSVNIAELDSQHQNLFRIIQNLHQSITAGRGQEVTEGALAQVVTYTMHHFSTEESLMQEHGFPGLAAHRLEHNNLTLKISRLQEEHAEGKSGAAERLLRFLLHWLEEHTLKTDQEYVEFFDSKAAGKQVAVESD
jgi:hemerythrin